MDTVNVTLRAVLDTWRDVLGADVGRSDDFYDCGGTSLAAMRIVARLSSVLSKDVPIRLLLEFPNPLAFAERLDQLEHSRSSGAVVKLGGSREVSLSDWQRRKAAPRVLQGNARHHVLGRAYWVRGALNIEALSRALHIVVARHEQLCLRFFDHRGAVRAHVAPIAREILVVEECRGVREQARRRDFARRVRKASKWRFDLAHPPLARVELVRYSDVEAGLIVIVDHVVSDGWSYSVLCRELAVAYSACIDGEPPNLAAPVLQFSQISGANNQVRTRQREQDERFWRDHLEASIDAVDLMPGRPREITTSQRSWELPEELSEEIASSARERRVTPYVLWLTCLAIVARRWSGRDRFSVMSPFAGRDRPEAGVEDVFGPLGLLFPIPIDLSTASNVQGALAQVARAVLLVHAHSGVDYVELVHQTGSEQSTWPLRQLFFSFEEDDGLVLSGVELEPDPVRYDLQAVYELGIFVKHYARQRTRVVAVGVFGSEVKRFVDEMLQVLQSLLFEHSSTDPLGGSVRGFRAD